VQGVREGAQEFGVNRRREMPGLLRRQVDATGEVLRRAGRQLLCLLYTSPSPRDS